MKPNIILFLLLTFYSCEMNKNISNKTPNSINIKQNISILNQIRRNPGIYIQGNNEQNAKVFIRGITSINFQKEVLFILDGLQVGNFSQLVNILDPNDIKNIQVLKNASDLNIYGFRGSGGVIIIKTR
jgi:TonB-dependent SusC/RagA subfamily outer membrane receptor